MDTNEKKTETENKYDLVNGTFKARTTKIYAVLFKGEGGKEDSHRLAVDIIFSEGPNEKRSATFLCGDQNTEFFMKVLIAIGWEQGTNPLKTPVGYELSAVVDTDTNPKTGKKRNQVKYLNAIGSAGGGMQKYQMDDAAATAWIRGPMTQVAALIKSTGTVIPKPNPIVAPSNGAAPAGGGAGNQRPKGPAGEIDDTDIPFVRPARGEEV